MKTYPFLLATTGSTGDGRNINQQKLEQIAIRPENRACCHYCHNTYEAPMCCAEIRERAFMDQMKLVLG